MNTPRFIKLSSETLKILYRFDKYSVHHRTRTRAHILILSHFGHSISDILAIYQYTRRSIYNLFNAFEKENLLALYDKKARGAKPKLSLDQKNKLKEWIKLYPKNLKAIVQLVKENFNIKVSKNLVKGVLKFLNYTWHRIKHKTAKEPEKQEYELKKQELEELKKQHQNGQINLYYGDASGFSLSSNVPCAWQIKGEYIEIPASKSKIINVFGFMCADSNDLQAYKTTDTLNSEFLIKIIDDFCKTINFKTVLVLDNAPIHKSKLFFDQLERWKAKGLEIFYLPSYSPKLNRIEKLWWFMKLEWIDFKAYLSLENLNEYIDDIIINFGGKYEINFG